MLEKHRHLLIKFRGEIVEDLLVDDVLPYLRSKFVLDSEDAEVIRKELTSRRQAEKLLDILSSKGYNTFDHFFTVLKEKYQHLAQLLSSDESSEDENGFNQVTEDIDSPLQCKYKSKVFFTFLFVEKAIAASFLYNFLFRHWCRWNSFNSDKDKFRNIANLLCSTTLAKVRFLLLETRHGPSNMLFYFRCIFHNPFFLLTSRFSSSYSNGLLKGNEWCLTQYHEHVNIWFSFS